MTINCIIIEDEPLAQDLLHDYIDKVDFLKLGALFNNPLEALPYLKGNDVDLLFLDIEMPKLNGMDFLNVLEDLPRIIFTTAYSTYAVKSYEKNALDYLLKPITYERFLAAINKFPQVESSTYKIDNLITNKAIFIKAGKNLVQLNYNDIFFISGLKDYVEFHTKEKKYVVYHTLKELQQKLPAMFSRVHHSYLVNLDRLKKIKDNHIHILDSQIPISATYRKALYEKIDQRML